MTSVEADSLTREYEVLGMHCGGCATKVESALSVLPGIDSVKVNLENAKAQITMAKDIPLQTLNVAVAGVGAYHLETAHTPAEHFAMTHRSNEHSSGTTAGSYYPLFLVVGFVTAFSIILSLKSAPTIESWMGYFMSLFFVAFSFFKLLDIRGFALSYSSYDIIAKRWIGYGYVYPFLELALGIAYLLVPMSTILNILTTTIMSISIIGVIESVTNKRKIQCACLGTVFNLPMGTVTIVEDALMIVMAVAMLVFAKV